MNPNQQIAIAIAKRVWQIVSDGQISESTPYLSEYPDYLQVIYPWGSQHFPVLLDGVMESSRGISIWMKPPTGKNSVWKIKITGAGIDWSNDTDILSILNFRREERLNRKLCRQMNRKVRQTLGLPLLMKIPINPENLSTPS